MSVKIIIEKQVNMQKLIQEFANAGFLQTSSRPDEFITVEDTDDVTAVTNIYNLHDPNSLTWEEIRIKRDALLTSSDWTQVKDAPISANEQEMWSAYRQLLRDIPQMYENAKDVVFPAIP